MRQSTLLVRRLPFVPPMLLVAALSLSACGSSATTSSGNLTAGQLFALAIKNATNGGSVHEDIVSHHFATATSAAKTFSMVNDIGTAQGRQVINYFGAHAMVLFVGGNAYFQGDRAGLINYFSFSTTIKQSYVNRWILLAPGDPGFPTVSSSLILSSDFAQIKIQGPYTEGAQVIVNGVLTIPIHGFIVGTSSKIAATLNVTASGTTLPVLLTEGNSQATATAAWSRWGEHLAFVAPLGAIPIAQVPV